MASRRPGQIIRRTTVEPSWTVRLYLGVGADGKREYRNYTVKGERKDAEAFLRARLDELGTGRLAEKHRKTVDGFLQDWLETAKTRLRLRTWEEYVGLAKRYVAGTEVGKARLDSVTPLQIQRLYAQLQGERGLSAKSVRHVHNLLNQALKQAVLWNLVSYNPVANTCPPKQVRKEMQAFGPEQARLFLAAASEDRWFVLWSFVLATGLRFGEFAGLKWDDVDWFGGQVFVRRSLSRPRTTKGAFLLTEPKTAKSRRAVAVPENVMELLKEHRARQAEERLALGELYAPHNFVFAVAGGRPLHLGHLTMHSFKPILRRAGLPDMRIHDLRHSCATLLLAAGENPKIVSERLGHSSTTFTLDTYSHCLPNMQKSAADKLQSMLFGAPLPALPAQTGTVTPFRKPKRTPHTDSHTG